MTKDEFVQLEESHRESGLSLMKYLRKIGLSYSTYNYWKHKLHTLESDDSSVPFAQVSLRPSSPVVLSAQPSRMTLCFPNGVRVCLESGMEESASRLITSYPYSHVLPE